MSAKSFVPEREQFCIFVDFWLLDHCHKFGFSRSSAKGYHWALKIEYGSRYGVPAVFEILKPGVSLQTCRLWYKKWLENKNHHSYSNTIASRS